MKIITGTHLSLQSASFIYPHRTINTIFHTFKDEKPITIIDLDDEELSL